MSSPQKDKKPSEEAKQELLADNVLARLEQFKKRRELQKKGDDDGVEGLTDSPRRKGTVIRGRSKTLAESVGRSPSAGSLTPSKSPSRLRPGNSTGSSIGSDAINTKIGAINSRVGSGSSLGGESRSTSLLRRLSMRSDSPLRSPRDNSVDGDKEGEREREREREGEGVDKGKTVSSTDGESGNRSPSKEIQSPTVVISGVGQTQSGLVNELKSQLEKALQSNDKLQKKVLEFQENQETSQLKSEQKLNDLKNTLNAQFEERLRTEKHRYMQLERQLLTQTQTLEAQHRQRHTEASEAAEESRRILEQKVLDLESDFDEMTQRCEKVTVERGRLEEENEENRKLLRQIVPREKQLRHDYEVMKEKFDSLRDDFDVLDRNHRDLSVKYKQEAETRRDFETKYKDTAEERDHSSRRLQELEGRLTTLQEVSEKERTQLRNLKRELEKLRDENAILEQKCEVFDVELEETQHRLAKFEEMKKRLAEENQKMEIELAEIKARSGNLERREKALNESQETYKEELMQRFEMSIAQVEREVKSEKLEYEARLQAEYESKSLSLQQREFECTEARVEWEREVRERYEAGFRKELQLLEKERKSLAALQTQVNDNFSSLLSSFHSSLTESAESHRNGLEERALQGMQEMEEVAERERETVEKLAGFNSHIHTLQTKLLSVEREIDIVRTESLQAKRELSHALEVKERELGEELNRIRGENLEKDRQLSTLREEKRKWREEMEMEIERTKVETEQSLQRKFDERVREINNIHLEKSQSLLEESRRKRVEMLEEFQEKVVMMQVETERKSVQKFDQLLTNLDLKNQQRLDEKMSIITDQMKRVGETVVQRLESQEQDRAIKIEEIIREFENKFGDVQREMEKVYRDFLTEGHARRLEVEENYANKLRQQDEKNNESIEQLSGKFQDLLVEEQERYMQLTSKLQEQYMKDKEMKETEFMLRISQNEEKRKGFESRIEQMYKTLIEQYHQYVQIADRTHAEGIIAELDTQIKVAREKVHQLQSDGVHDMLGDVRTSLSDMRSTFEKYTQLSVSFLGDSGDSSTFSRTKLDQERAQISLDVSQSIEKVLSRLEKQVRGLAVVPEGTAIDSEEYRQFSGGFLSDLKMIKGKILNAISLYDGKLFEEYLKSNGSVQTEIMGFIDRLRTEQQSRNDKLLHGTQNMERKYKKLCMSMDKWKADYAQNLKEQYDRRLHTLESQVEREVSRSETLRREKAEMETIGRVIKGEERLEGALQKLRGKMNPGDSPPDDVDDIISTHSTAPSVTANTVASSVSSAAINSSESAELKQLREKVRRLWELVDLEPVEMKEIFFKVEPFLPYNADVLKVFQTVSERLAERVPLVQLITQRELIKHELETMYKNARNNSHVFDTDGARLSEESSKRSQLFNELLEINRQLFSDLVNYEEKKGNGPLYFEGQRYLDTMEKDMRVLSRLESEWEAFASGQQTRLGSSPGSVRSVHSGSGMSPGSGRRERESEREKFSRVPRRR